jgi:hypothetical protein
MFGDNSYFALCDPPLLLRLFVAGDLESFLGPLLIVLADDFKVCHSS